MSRGGVGYLSLLREVKGDELSRRATGRWISKYRRSKDYSAKTTAGVHEQAPISREKLCG